MVHYMSTEWIWELPMTVQPNGLHLYFITSLVNYLVYFCPHKQFSQEIWYRRSNMETPLMYLVSVFIVFSAVFYLFYL